MYLKNISIPDFRTIKNAGVGFEPGLNLVIGKNGAGKSNLLTFIHRCATRLVLMYDSDHWRNGAKTPWNFTLCDESTDTEHRYEVIPNRKKVYDAPPSVDVTVTATTKTNDRVSPAKVLLSPESNMNFGHIAALPEGDELKILWDFKPKYIEFDLPNIVSWVSTSVTFRFNGLDFEEDEPFVTKMSFAEYLTAEIESKFSSTLKWYFPIETDIVPRLRNNDRLLREIAAIFESLSFLEKISFQLEKWSPISSIRVMPLFLLNNDNDTLSISNLRLEFLVDGNWIPWDWLSDGTKRLFYLITEIYLLPQGLVLIEEPELGIHPHQLHGFMAFIKEQSVTKQIIISTHSPWVLDALDENELNRITIAKVSGGKSRFEKLTDEKTAKARRYMKEVGYLSDYWLHSDLED